MVRKSYGKMRKTRNKFSGKRLSGITHYIREFSPGDAVHVDILPSSKFPHARFQGSTGKVLAKRGNSYMVQITDGNAHKILFLRPEHLKLQKNKN